MVGAGPSLPLHSLTITSLLFQPMPTVMGDEIQEFGDLIFFEPVWLPSLFLLQMTGC